MELTLLAARLVLAAVFLLAGIAKLADHAASSKALTGFGLPQRIAQPLSLLLSTAEIAVAAALVPVALAWYGACGALVLLSIFVLGIVANLARGRKPDCRCFGQLHSAPVGWPTLVRNGLLAALAGWLVARGPLGIGPPLWTHLAAAGGNERRLFIFAACVMCFLLFRALWGSEPAEPEGAAIDSQAFEESPRAPGENPEPSWPANPEPREILPLPIGTPAPPFALPTVTGQKCSLQSLLERGKTIFLVFSSPYCDPCRALMPYLRGWMQQHEESLHIVVVSRGTAQENLAKLKDVEASHVLLQQAFEVADVYGCTATPSAVLVGTNGLIESDVAVGRPAIEELISSFRT